MSRDQLIDPRDPIIHSELRILSRLFSLTRTQTETRAVRQKETQCSQQSETWTKEEVPTLKQK